MSFVSLEFLIFSFINFFFFKYLNFNNYFLIIIGGALFYSWFYWPYLFLLLFLCLITFYGTEYVMKIKSKFLLCFLILIVLFPLIFFKYNNLLGLIDKQIITPLGISFITFTLLTYVIDIYEKKFTYKPNFKILLAYIFFFPQMVAGPILRPSQLIPQIIKKNKIVFDEKFKLGFFLILLGLIKKLIIADRIASSIDPLFLQIDNLNLFEKIYIMYGFTIQIYCDFSGYTDIAIGLAKILRIDLPVNFKSPYLSRNPVEFWRSWHITLSMWFRDYIYFRISNKNEQILKNFFSVTFTMLLCGIWHGASINFILWGVIHAIGIYWIHLMNKLNVLSVNKYLSIFLTFNFISFCWIFFRITDVENIIIFFGNLNTFDRLDFFIIIKKYYYEILLMAFVLILHKFDTLDYFKLYLQKIKNQSFVMICIFLILILLLMSEIHSPQFIYFDF